MATGTFSKGYVSMEDGEGQLTVLVESRSGADSQRVQTRLDSQPSRHTYSVPDVVELSIRKLKDGMVHHLVFPLQRDVVDVTQRWPLQELLNVCETGIKCVVLKRSRHDKTAEAHQGERY